MLSTDDGFPWGTVILMTLLLTALFTTTIIFMPKLLSRWFQRRDTPVVEEEEEEDLRFTYSHSSHSSQERYVQTEPEPDGIFVLLTDASTQVLDWQSFFE